jgi:hypothetical protein
LLRTEEEETQFEDEHAVKPTETRWDRPLCDSSNAVTVIDVDPETAAPPDDNATIWGGAIDWFRRESDFCRETVAIISKFDPAPECNLDTTLLSAIQVVAEQELKPNRILDELKSTDKTLPKTFKNIDPEEGIAKGAATPFLSKRGLA